MLRAILFILLFTGCAATSAVVTPPVPIKPVPKEDTVIIKTVDTFIRTVTVTQLRHDTTYLKLPSTETITDIWLSPDSSGDNSPQFDAAKDYQVNHPACTIHLAPGYYPYSHTWFFAKIVGNDYVQVRPSVKGPCNAKNSPDNNNAHLVPLFADAPAVACQLCKGGGFSDFAIDGPFYFPDAVGSSLTDIQVDTLAFNEWKMPGVSDNATAVQCGIDFDPASDPGFYDGVYYKMYPPSSGIKYIPGMSRSGSTAVICSGLAITDCVVGIIVSNSAQQNGEMINLENSEVDACKVSYALCQAQSKQNRVVNLEVWRQTHTVFDNVTYGIRQGDGACSPFIDGLNGAGAIHQLFNLGNNSFLNGAQGIYMEGLFKIGNLGGSGTSTILYSQIDFNSQKPGTPSPDFYMNLFGVTSIGCVYRLYPGCVVNSSGTPLERIVLNGKNNIFQGGAFNHPPVNQQAGNGPLNNVFINVLKCYDPYLGTFNDGNCDTLVYQEQNTVYVNKADWTGYFVTQKPLYQSMIGNPVITTGHFMDQFSFVTGNRMVGQISKISSDTAYFCNAGWGIQSGQSYFIQVPVLRPGY